MGTRNQLVKAQLEGEQGEEASSPEAVRRTGPKGRARGDSLDVGSTGLESQEDLTSERDHARIQRDTPPQKKHVGFTRQGSI